MERPLRPVSLKVGMEGTTKKPRRRLGPPPDSDLIGIPLVLGVVVAALAVMAMLVYVGWVGMILLVVVLLAALAVTYRVVTDSDSDSESRR
jgi:hypothetical protein